MYTGPIIRTFSSTAQYQQDIAMMATYGYQPVNVERRSQTNGLVLTLILLFGILLTPVCVGIVILCFLPLAFWTQYVVTYIPRVNAPSYSQPYSQPLTPPAYGGPYSRPLAGTYTPMPLPSQPMQAYPTLPPTQPPVQEASPGAPLWVRVQEAVADVQQFVSNLSVGRRILLALAALVALAVVVCFTALVVWSFAHLAAPSA